MWASLMQFDGALAFVTLALLEIVLGIDNLVVLSILIGHLPPARRSRQGRSSTGFFTALGSRCSAFRPQSSATALEI